MMHKMRVALLSGYVLLWSCVALGQGTTHVEWVASVLREIQSIEPGATRAELLTLFTTEGGLSTGLQRTYVLRQCPYIKVDVSFRPVGRPARDASDRVTLVESEQDVIVSISRPYLAWRVAD